MPSAIADPTATTPGDSSSVAGLAAVTGVFDLSRVMYTQFYCEENIYHMIRDHVAPEHWGDFYVVFISNVEKCVALNFQKVGVTPDTPVYWDYHVILLHHPRATAPHTLTVYDLDTLLPFGTPHHAYLAHTFPPTLPDPRLAHPPAPARFKLVPALDYMRMFASTRAHMWREYMTEDGDLERRWAAEPPPWPAVVSAEEGEDTLERFLDFGHAGDRFGRVYAEGEFRGLLDRMVREAV
ncbi:N-terminal glutamine amidase-domain-containing protein [Morchella snyderi]|nr:N-terminal glutamine amidase-domain-containing protein [Morchella snyderi]